MIRPEQVEVVPDFTGFGVHAFTTTRSFGSFSSASDEPVKVVMGRWSDVRASFRDRGVQRLATAAQVHGAHVIVHRTGWLGWLRGPEADGHVSLERGTAVAVTVADCVPVFIAHDSGAVGILHSGWRGTAARIVQHGISALTGAGLAAAELRLHLGPAICGKCYEVSPDVFKALIGETVASPRPVDLRAIIARDAEAVGVRQISISPLCTRCNNDRFYSHRAGDAGRQVAMIAATG
jgi:YfiH family protein